MATQEILTGWKAKRICKKILKRGHIDNSQSLWWCAPFVAGYFLDKYIKSKKKCWVAFDNTTGNCWVENFDTEAKAIAWCEGKLEVV